MEMDLYREMLEKIVEEESIRAFEGEKIESSDLQKRLEMRCYKALCQIREIIRDDSLDDEECFLKLKRSYKCLKKQEVTVEADTILDNSGKTTERRIGCARLWHSG